MIAVTKSMVAIVIVNRTRIILSITITTIITVTIFLTINNDSNTHNYSHNNTSNNIYLFVGEYTEIEFESYFVTVERIIQASTVNAALKPAGKPKV